MNGAERTPEADWPAFASPVFASLVRAGLNLHAVFDVAALPQTLGAACATVSDLPRLWLVGHGGRALWDRVLAARAQGGLPDEHPIDAYSERCVRDWLAASFPAARAHFLYPQPLAAPATLDLQQLGALAGWHYPAPFRVGINRAWGSWFAYRALVLTDAPLASTPRLESESPCASCSAQPCLGACPAGALGEVFDLARCLDYRLAADSGCALTCRARLACPVGREHRYDDAQLAHSYGESLRMLNAWR